MRHKASLTHLEAFPKTVVFNKHLHKIQKEKLTLCSQLGQGALFECHFNFILWHQCWMQKSQHSHVIKERMQKHPSVATTNRFQELSKQFSAYYTQLVFKVAFHEYSINYFPSLCYPPWTHLEGSNFPTWHCANWAISQRCERVCVCACVCVCVGCSSSLLLCRQYFFLLSWIPANNNTLT